MNTENVVYTHNGILFNLKKGNSAICDNTDEPWRYYAKWNKLATEGQMLHNSNYMRSLKIIQYKESECYSSCQGVGGGGGTGELLVNEHKVSVKQDKYVLEIRCTTLHL